MPELPTPDNLPTSKDVIDAARQMFGIALNTPTLEFPALNERAGCRVLLKPEIFQITGTFKFRGAWNRLSRLPKDQKPRGVVAFSSGNHAQGVAAAAQKLGIPAVIVMPEDAPGIKIRRTRAWGAQIVFFDRYTQDREVIAADLIARNGGVLVPSYDDFHIIAGQGTAALELFDDAASRGIEISSLLIPCGGGGLTAGSVLARDVRSPKTDIFTVEPEGYDDHARSFISGNRETADVTQRSNCDALLSPTPGKLTFAINKTGVKSGLVITEDEVKDAMQLAFSDLKLVVEPGGSAALAALLSGKITTKPEDTVAIILSGGNVDIDGITEAMQAPPTSWQDNS